MEDLKAQLKTNTEKIEKLDAQLQLQLRSWMHFFFNWHRNEIKDLKERISEITQQNNQIMQNITQIATAEAAPSGIGEILNQIVHAQNQIVNGQNQIRNDVRQVKKKQQEAELEKLDVWSESKRSEFEQPAFKNDLINYYQRQDPNNANNLLCMGLNQSLPKSDVIASHIYKHAFPINLDAFGIDRTEINNPRNGLLLAKKIEQAFDIKHLCFLYNPINQQLVFRVLNPALLPVQIHNNYPDTFAALNNQPLQLPAGVYPWKRLLGFHAHCSYRYARQVQWITATDHDHFKQHEDFVMKSVGAIDPEVLQEDDD